MALTEQTSPESSRTPPADDPPGEWESSELSDSNRPISDGERIVSLASGAILGLFGVSRRNLPGLLIAGVGGSLLYRGTRGEWPLSGTLGSRRADPRDKQKRANHDTYVSQTFLINRSPEELYSYWRDFENLPRIMSHLKSVQVLDERRSQWVATAPAIAGGQVEWDAEITRDEPNARIDWRSVEGSRVPNRGSVRFAPAPRERGTMVRVIVDYRPPGGNVGRLLASLFHQAPEQQIREDLRNFKRVMEIGEVLTREGQPRGTCLGRGKRE